MNKKIVMDHINDPAFQYTEISPGKWQKPHWPEFTYIIIDTDGVSFCNGSDDTTTWDEIVKEFNISYQ